jgi:hypothetical protein
MQLQIAHTTTFTEQCRRKCKEHFGRMRSDRNPTVSPKIKESFGGSLNGFLLADPPSGRIGISSNRQVSRSFGALHYIHLKLQYLKFIS